MMENNPPHNLYWIRIEAKNTFRTLTDNCEGFIKQVI